MTFAKIGDTRIELPDNLTDAEAVKQHLAFSYPEVENAEIRTKTEDEHTVYEFVPRAGRKG